ncbi:MAG: flagellar hook protein FlgE [Deltaproteobacteria bacterium]|nr:flagellar hook protein FlgE [Deltaproteobacteria bacterium]
MGSSLFAGISGLTASSKQLDVIGNNIANTNTVGFKAGKISFGDILSQSITGGAASGMQVGRGVEVTSIATQFASGSFETTANATDLAIDGEGFFTVKDDEGGEYYTRAGSFSLDNEGYLVDTNGYKVQGYNLTAADPYTIADISLANVQSVPTTTTTISIGSNLNSATATGSTFNASQTVYDSLGGEHALKVTFQKTEGTGYWGFKGYLDNTAATTQGYSGMKFDEDGDLEYVYSSTTAATATDGDDGAGYYDTAGTGTAAITVNNQGQLYKDTTAPIVLTRVDADSWTITNNGGYANMSLTYGTAVVDDSIAIDLDGAGGADITFALENVWAADDTIEFTIAQTEVAPADVDLTLPSITGATIGNAGVISWDLAGTTANSVTQYASTSVVKTLTHDGYSSGSLKSISVASDGTISGFFTNGQTSDIAQVILSDFANQKGLKRMGNNLFATTVESGAAVPNTPGSAGMGEISPNSLEMSNTDIATEFINMITAQRAYQASAKIVTVTDTMMGELMNIKR